MIEINHALLSNDALNNLIIDHITQQSTEYIDTELPIENRKNEIIKKLDNGEAIIVYSSKEKTCHIIPLEKLQEIQKDELKKVTK